MGEWQEDFTGKPSRGSGTVGGARWDHGVLARTGREVDVPGGDGEMKFCIVTHNVLRMLVLVLGAWNSMIRVGC